MADVAFIGANGTGASTTSSTTVTITTTRNVRVGQTIIVCVATDNLSATTPTFTYSDTAGNTYSARQQKANNATAAAGIAGGIGVAKVTAALASGSTITVTTSGNVAQKAAQAFVFENVADSLRNSTTAASGASTAPAVTTGSATTGDLVFAAIARESNATPSAYDSDTTNGNWSTAVNSVSVSGGTATSRVGIASQYKIVTASATQAYNNTLPASTDWAAMAVVLIGEVGTTATAATATASLTGEASVETSTTASLSATASLTATAVVVDSTTGTLTTATGSLTAAGVVVDASTAALSSTASLTSAATVEQGAVEAQASLSASAALTGAGVVVDSGGAALAASAALTATGVVVVPASAVLASTASLAASATRSADATAAVEASASLLSTALINDDAESVLDAVAELLAAGNVRSTIEVTISAGSVPYPPSRRRWTGAVSVSTGAQSVPYPPTESQASAVTVTTSAK